MAATEDAFSSQQPPDPDVQTTLSDFLTYTEHFPSHLTRALNLIHDQRLRAEEKIKAIHDDTTTYALLPTLPAKDRPSPAELRKRISYALEDAERACRMSVEEATRLDDTAKREAVRLDLVTERLKAQPMPPSRDPTPEQQQALTSPNLRREGRLGTRHMEATISPEKPHKRQPDKAASKLRTRKIMVPGEVLPPPDPNALAESMSDWTSPRASPPVEEAPLQLSKATPRPRSRTPKVPKLDKLEKQKKANEVEKVEKAPKIDSPELLQTDGEPANQKPIKPRAPRQPGQTGTNAHSAVAGISTSNALLALKAPPEDAPKGSKWLPWQKLTEFEMAKLRKRMKKNAIWVPSPTMVRRELKTLGRGPGYKDIAKQNAQATGEDFVDEHDQADPTKVFLSGEEQMQMDDMLGPQVYDENDDADAELINRGMRLNEAKKLKRQRMLEEQALQAQMAREQGGEGAPAADPTKLVAGSSETQQKKRKRDTTPPAPAGDVPAETPDPLSKPAPPLKKLKISVPDPRTSKVPLAPAGGSSSPKTTTTSRSRRAATPPAVRKPLISLKAAKAVSEEPPNRRASLRRGSNASLPSASANSLTSPARTAAAAAPAAQAPKTTGRRSKRPAPGIIANGDEDSAKLLLSKRKAAPRKSAKKASTPAATHTATAATTALPSSDGPQTADEYVDPDEPRYCVCGDVSWGTMIACDNEEDCEKEWFHLTCVGLEDLPPRRTKWYCPDCRKRLKLGVGTNGLVGRGVGAGR